MTVPAEPPVGTFVRVAYIGHYGDPEQLGDGNGGIIYYRTDEGWQAPGQEWAGTDTWTDLTDLATLQAAADPYHAFVLTDVQVTILAVPPPPATPPPADLLRYLGEARHDYVRGKPPEHQGDLQAMDRDDLMVWVQAEAAKNLAHILERPSRAWTWLPTWRLPDWERLTGAEQH